ncbi:Ig-like domain-containing protein [Filimonas lacunae]|nr:gliding motility-associated C-terminal domain-containing protein [Filimonas lacunae]
MMKLYTGRMRSYLKTFAIPLLFFCSFYMNRVSAQRVYANQVTIGTAASDHVTNPTNAISSSETSFAQLNSYGGVAVGLGSYQGTLELKFPTTVGAGVTTYVRINTDTGLLKSLLGGSLGNLLANVLGTVVLGNHYFNIQARNGATAVLSGASSTPFSADNLKLVQDVNGYYYIALTPAAAYDRIYIQDVTNAVLLGTSNSTQVYYAFYNASGSSDPCVQGFATSFDGSGLSLDALQLGNAGVRDPKNIIDTDTTNYSELGLGALAVAGSISQDVYFDNLSKADDEFHLQVQSSPALLNVGLANNITVNSYNGTTLVSTQQLNTLLGLDLVGLLNSGQKTPFIIRPGQPVNRIRLTFSSLLNANLTQTIRYYGAIRTAGKPTFGGSQSQNYTICTGGSVGLNATTSTGNEIRWYADSTSPTPLFTTSSGATYNTGALSATRSYFVAAAKIGCTYESERVRVTVTVKTIPLDPVVPAVQPVCTGRTATFAVTNPETGVTYRWYTGATGGAVLDSGVSFVTPLLTDSTTFYVEASNGTCTNTNGRTAVLVPVSKLPLVANPTPLTRQICSGRTTSFAIQNPETGVVYNWYDAATGGNLLFTGTNFVTPQLAASTNYYVEAVNASGCTNGARIQLSVTVQPSPSTPILVDPVANVNPGSAATFTIDGPIDGLAYNWYDSAAGGTLLHTGTSYTTPALSNSASFYVEAADPGGCSSLTRAMVTVNVVNDVVCGYATSQSTQNQSLCLLCAVTNGDNAIGADLGSYSTISTTVGVGGFGQLFKFGNTGYPGDSISVILEVPGQLLSATLLGGIAIQTYSGNNANGDLVFLDSAVASAQLLGTGGSGKIKVTVPAKNSFDGVAVTLAGVSAVGQLRIYAVQTYAGTPLLAPQSVLAHAGTQSGPVTTGVCVGCSITDPLLAVDGDTTTHSTITATVGVAATVGQVLKFSGNYSAGDSIQIDLEVPSQVLGAQVLGAISLETYTGNVANGDATVANSGLVKAQLLGLGGGRFRLKLAAPHSFNGIAVVLNGVANVLSNLYVYDAAVFSSRQNIVNVCTGSSAVLTVNSPVNATINWYTTAAGGSPVFTGTTYTTPPVTTPTTYYIESSRYGCVNVNRTQVNVVPNTIPDNPTLNATSVSICSGDSAKLYVTAPVGMLIKWYTTASGGTPVYTGDTLVTPALTANTSYYVESVNNGCSSTGRATAVVTVNAAPADVAVTPPSAVIGSGQTASFVASSSTPNTTFSWYAVATGGTPAFTGPNFTTPALTASTNYYLGAGGANTCSLATRLVVPVTVFTGSGVPVPCDVATTQTTAVGGLCVLCSVDSAALAVDNDASTSSELHVIAGLTNAYVQQTLGFPFTGDAGDTVAIHVTFPVGLTDISVVSSLQVASYNGATYNNDRTTVANNGLVQLQLLSGDTNGIIKFVPTQVFDRVELRMNSGLATLLSAVHVGYAQRIKAGPIVNADTVAICAGQQATLIASSPANTTFKWYSDSTGGTLLIVGATYITPALTDTTIYYAESVSNTGCAALVRKPVVVNVIPAPGAPAVTDSTVTTCAGVPATLSVQNPQAGITYSWYSNSTGGTAIFTGSSFTTPALSADTVYYVGASNGTGCISATRSMVTVVVNAGLQAPVVASDSVASCSGNATVLSVQNPQGSFTYNWYNVPVGGAVLATGASFTTPAITGDTTFYVEAVGGTNCVSPRTGVAVTLSQPPAAPVVTVNAPGAVIQAGQSASITATSATAGVTFNWFLQPSGGTAVFTGATYNTPPLTATTTYYVEAVLAGAACSTSTRTAVTITVNPGVNLACDAATSETNTVDGLCIGCGITNAGGAVDTDTATASTLNIAVGLVNAYAEQILKFPSVSTAGDTVAILLEGPPTVLAADILSGIQIQSYNGATPNGDAVSLNNGLIHIQLLGLGAGGKFIAKFVPAQPFDGIQVRATSGLVSALTSVNIYYTTRLIAPPVLTSNNPVAICSGGTTTLTATASPNATIEWYTNGVSGDSLVATGASYTTPALANTAIYYAQARRTSTNCPNLNRVQVAVLVNAAPQTPVAANDTVQVCAGKTAVLTLNGAQTGVTYNWYNASGVLGGTGTSFTTPALSTSTFYSVEAVNTGSTCVSTNRDTVNVTVNTLPVSRGIVGTNDSTVVCSGSATLQILNPDAGVTYNWYNVANGGSIVFSGTTFQTPVLTATTVYYIEAVNAAGCSTGARTAATVVVNPVLPPPTVVSNNVSVCSGSAATLQVQNAQTGAIYRWYDAPVGGNALFDGATFVTPALTANTSYFVEVISAAGCTGSSRTQVTVTVNAQPATPTLANVNVAICAGNAASFQVQNVTGGITYKWYDSATGGNLLFTGASFTTPTLAIGATYYVEATNSAGCASVARATAVVNVTPAPVTPVINGNGSSVCSGGTVALSVQTPQQNVTYNWYDAGGTLVAVGTTYTTAPLTTATVYSVDAVSAAGCSAPVRAVVTIMVNTTPAAPVIAGATNPVCSGNSAVLSVQTPQAGTVYNWYDAPTAGNLLFSGTSITTPGLTTGVTYYVGAANGGCTSGSRTQVTVTVNTRPADAVIDAAGTNICAGNPTTLTVNNVQPGLSYSWYTASSGGNLVTTGSSYTTPVLNASVTYYVEVTNGTCTGNARTTVNVTVSQSPSAPAVTGTSICSGSQATLTIASPQTGIIYRWYDAAAGGNLLMEGTTYVTSAISANTTFYVESSSAAGCAASIRTAVPVTVNTQPVTPVLVNSGVVTCSGSTATLSIQTPQPGIAYLWYDAATGGNLVFSGSTFVTPALTTNTNYYVEASSGTGCSSATRAAATVQVSNVLQPPTVSATGTTACIGQSTTLQVENAQTDLTYRWYTAGSGGLLLATGSSYTTLPLAANATYFVEVSNATCTASSRTQVNVTVVAPPSAPVIAATGRTICAGTPATLSVQSPDSRYVYNWYDLPAGGNLLFTGNTYATNVLNNSTSYYVETAVNAGCVSTTRATVAVTVNAVPDAPAVVSDNVVVCSGSAATLQVQNPVSGYTYNWYSTAAGGAVLFTGANYVLNNITSGTVYYVEAVNASSCASSTRSTVNVTVSAAPAAPAIANSTPAVCSGSMVTLTASSSVPGAVYNWYNSANSNTVIFTGSTFATGAITSDTTFYVAVSNAGGCASTDRGQTTVTIYRPLAAPVVTVDSVTSASVTFKWNAVAGAIGYEVTLDGVTFTTPNGNNGLSHTIGGLQPNQEVSIQVRAIGAQVCQTSSLSAKVSGTATNPLGNSVFIPNVFTPNNDGKNDYFTALSNNIATLEMWIYSQWGELIYHTQDRTGWNGMAGGQLQPVGVYVYIFKIKLLDGTTIDRKGSVSLVR